MRYGIRYRYLPTGFSRQRDLRMLITLKALGHHQRYTPSFNGTALMMSWGCVNLHHPRLLRLPWAPYRMGRNMNLLSISYACRPRLRVRLTHRGLTVRWKPYAYGDQDSHLVYRYSFQHNHLDAVQRSSPSAFTPHPTLPYPAPTPAGIDAAVASVGRLSPDYFRHNRASTGELLRTL